MITYVDLDKKTVDWKKDLWPEENPFEVLVDRKDDEEISLANYRYKSTKGDPKAVIMLLHGYGSWTGKYGYYAKYFADQGYDVLGYDYRGFGKTEGQSGHIASWEQHMSDAWTYFDIVKEEYKETSIIGCGYSLGGGTSYCMAIERPDAFRALMQIAPFAGYHIGKHPYQAAANTIAKFYPALSVCPPLRNPVPHMVHYYDDPLQVVAGSTAASLVALDICQKTIQANVDKLTVDMHVTIGDEENVVSRVECQKITKEAPAIVKEYYEWPGVNHYIINDGIYMEDIIRNQLDFLERILKE
ncbi:unnamed protein product [Moneuplotes crassus]|uniref:Serine aminopeptidase S33 domain-containing protein n=1 Tax=Euplotes crassus TaxID=5936 RepID=A0AAD2CZG1_EUPCR|nr:unnamed protein product [Moneuplotes crassus]